MTPYQKQIEIRWADTDPNFHVRHSAYYDYGAHVRIRFFAELGFSAREFNRRRLGPILFKEECSFIRELLPEELITVNLLRGPVSEDGGRWVLHHEIFNAQGQKSAHLTCQGAWMDLDQRKLTLPPPEISTAVLSLPPGEPYVYRKETN